MKRLTAGSVALLLILVSQAVYAQPYADMIRENHDRAASNYHYYEFSDSELTEAPKGYRPFYISHYSRHGSRYHTSARFFRPMDMLALCDSLGLLTDVGKGFYADARAVMEEHQGMYGMLSSRGAEELRGVGERLYVRFPELFSGKNGRTLVRNYSTTVQRSIFSMINMMTVLIEKSCGKMEFSYVTGDKYYEYLCHRMDNYLPMADFDNEVEDSLLPELDVDRLSGIFFNDPQAACAIIKDSAKFFRSLYMIAAISPNTDCRPDMLSCFPEEELVKFWAMRNNYFYAGCGNSVQMHEEVEKVSKPLVADFIERADDALAGGSNVAGDFRFGHDTGLLPLVGHLGITGMSERYDAFEAHKFWNSSVMIPMASNLQMIFYRSRKCDDVLVKLLYNEKETMIPALKPVTGPYYRWADLRSHMQSLL